MLTQLWVARRRAEPRRRDERRAVEHPLYIEHLVQLRRGAHVARVERDAVVGTRLVLLHVGPDVLDQDALVRLVTDLDGEAQVQDAEIVDVAVVVVLERDEAPRRVRRAEARGVNSPARPS